MKVTTYKTKKIVGGDNLYKIFDEYLPKEIPDKSVIVVSSKIVSICEGRIVKKISEDQRDELAEKEAELYLPRELNQYGYMITIKRSIMLGSGGVDQSNGNGFYILWPKDPQRSANKIREYLVKKYKISNLGIIIADSKSTPLRWGATGVAISHSGFLALKDYVGKPDIFGRLMRAEKASVMDSLATAATIEMGEGNEQKPIAIITDAKFVDFQKRNPTKKELDALKISIETDFYSPILTSIKWLKGGKSYIDKLNK